MNPLASLQHRYAQWEQTRIRRHMAGVQAVVREANTCWMPKGNLYTEHDIGNKMIRYPDGKRRSVAVTKIRDTGGVTFYSFAADTPLS
jgi:hypothetical protein